MSRVLRFDSGKIGALERTPTGGLFARGNIARTGIQVYRDADGTEVREYRPPDEVFATDTLASLDAAVVTIGHPQDLLTPQNVRQVMQGFMTGGTEREDTDDGVSWIVGRMALVTPEIMAGVDSGDLAELSAGYSLRIDATPGITPRGERYDRVQRDIRFNHVGFGPAGWARAGRDATLRLDGNENFPGDGRPEKESNKMAYRIDGKTVEDSDVQRAVVDLEAARDAAVIRADAADAKQGELASELAAANALAAELQASFDGRDAEISAEVAFRAEAGAHLPAGHVFGTRRDTHTKVLQALGSARLPREDDSDSLVEGLYQGAIAAAKAPPGKRTETKTDSGDGDAVRHDNLASRLAAKQNGKRNS